MQMKKEKSKGNRILTIVLSVAAGILVIIGILITLALSTPHAEQINQPIAPSNELAKKVLAGALSGEECSVTEEEINGFIDQKMALSSHFTSVNGAAIRRVILSFREDDTADAFLPIVYQNRAYDVSVNLTPSFSGGQLAMRVNSVHVGRLPVNPVWVIPTLKEALPETFTVSGTEIRMDGSVFHYKQSGVSADLNLSDIRLENRMLKLKVQGKLNTPYFGIFS